MAEERRRVNPEVLRTLVPINQLTEDNIRDVAGKTFLEKLPAGKTLFSKGDSDNLAFYLLAGEVVVATGTSPEKIIAGGTAPARFALDHHKPRQATVTAKSEIHFIRIDNDLLDVLLTWDQNSNYGVAEIDVNESEQKGQDWMTNILRSSLFHRVPPTNIQKMFMEMKAVPVKAGDVVIRQGDEGDYYYYVSEGRCIVSRDSPKGSIKLAELASGSSFGEEALISGTKRNANVTMLSDGILMRLAKTDFESLLKEPVLAEVTPEEISALVNEGALLLDVRLDSEHKNHSLPRSLHIPLYLLRIKAGGLDKSRKYIVYCDTGRRSSSAAYLLSERGFQAFVLKGGLMRLRQGVADSLKQA